MKKLTAKQRQRKPRRKLPARGPTASRKNKPEVDGYVVRLPDEPNPWMAGPDQPMIPVYVGWKGRAMHSQLAILFVTREEAERAASAFPQGIVEPRIIWDNANEAPMSWLDTMFPDPADKAAAFREPEDPDAPDAYAPLRKLEDELEAAMTLPDERAPRGEHYRERVIEYIHMNTELTYKIKLP